ncbi:hypothetical protein NADFUDRAFT_84301 [Nadsonia fulvescens var. elongata DSM 6958]|uniref:Pre-rRNA-processing protein ESF2 n=1 Tax=Nadsonia fulvescens var. elongata DSM 6958 TaxID=857566 RepID=A0A1E3PE42_9ASCO|nr:hypothetical protein NADFUDRAFT_84301 [Nadsonia fulvescens var. elongata DSM 6958]
MVKPQNRKQAVDFFGAKSDSESDYDSEVESANPILTNSQSDSEDVKTGRDLLDDDSEDDMVTDEEEEEKSKAGSSKNKRRKVEDFLSTAKKIEESEEEEDDDFELEDPTLENPPGKRLRKSNKVKALTPEEIEKAKKKIEKSGVCYISRIPPFMKPTRLRQIFSQFGELDRIFLTPEDSKVYAKRVKYGGNKKKNFIEGWVEFTKKKNAKTAAFTLNNNTIGGNKNNYYYDDILNVKYLPKFKWHNLTEQIALENQSRQSKLRAEIAQATKENKTFIKNFERSKMIENMKKSKEEKKLQTAGIDGNGPVDNKDDNIEIRRTFFQKVVASKRSDDKDNIDKNTNNTEIMNNVLSSVF